jgi:hypothetical protein
MEHRRIRAALIASADTPVEALVLLARFESVERAAAE